MSNLYSELLDNLKSRPSEWSSDNDNVLLDPFRYLTSIPGKEVRSALIDAFNAWLQVPAETLQLIKSIVQQLHTASLLVDDVEDDSQLRRGVPVAHKIFGVPQTINSANYVYFLAYKQLAKVSINGSSSDLLQDINDELLNLHRGQGIELYWREHLVCPSEEEYVQMVNNKTGGLFRIAIKLLLAAAATPLQDDCIPLVNLIGVLFQIRDDYQNLQSSQYSQNKGFCEDLTEGKFSFPILHSIRADTSNKRLISVSPFSQSFILVKPESHFNLLVLNYQDVLKQRPTDDATKTWAVTYMRDSTRSFAYTLSVLKTLDSQARAEIERFGGNKALIAILDMLNTD